jgi:hypothetical protein
VIPIERLTPPRAARRAGRRHAPDAAVRARRLIEIGD